VESNAKFLNVGQAAEYLGVSAASLRKWSNDGAVPVYRTPGGQRRYSRDDLDSFMESMREPAPSEVAVPRLGRGGMSVVR
jgi:excisionase family DNA binding protein